MVFKKAMSCGFKPLCMSNLLMTPIDAFKAAAQSANKVPIIKLFTVIVLRNFSPHAVYIIFWVNIQLK